MTTLVTALYAEGRTDERFLPILLQRSMTDWLARYANRVVDVLEPFVVNSSIEGSRAERILAVAQQVRGYHLLFVHADADDYSSRRAYTERVAPGLALVSDARLSAQSGCCPAQAALYLSIDDGYEMHDHDAMPPQRSRPGLETGARAEPARLQMVQCAHHRPASGDKPT